MPSCDDPEAVFATTTLPCVVLGGVPHPDPAEDLASWGRALIQPAVRGLVVGRALLYPPDGEVFAAVDAAAAVLRARRGAAVSLLRAAADTGAPGTVVDITPEDAGWDWTGLRVLRLAPGEPQTVRDRGVGAVRAPARGFAAA